MAWTPPVVRLFVHWMPVFVSRGKTQSNARCFHIGFNMFHQRALTCNRFHPVRTRCNQQDFSTYSMYNLRVANVCRYSLDECMFAQSNPLVTAPPKNSRRRSAVRKTVMSSEMLEAIKGSRFCRSFFWRGHIFTFGFWTKCCCCWIGQHSKDLVLQSGTYTD